MENIVSVVARKYRILYSKILTAVFSASLSSCHPIVSNWLESRGAHMLRKHTFSYSFGRPKSSSCFRSTVLRRSQISLDVIKY